MIIQRTVFAPALPAEPVIETVDIANADFSSWNGNVPSGWTLDSTSQVHHMQNYPSQGGNVVMLTADNRLRQTVTVTAGRSYRFSIHAGPMYSGGGTRSRITVGFDGVDDNWAFNVAGGFTEYAHVFSFPKDTAETELTIQCNVDEDLFIGGIAMRLEP